MKSLKYRFSILVVLMTLVSCTRDTEKREYQIMPDMTRHHALEAQETVITAKGDTISAMRMPVEGTIHRGHEPYLAETADEAALLVNPVKATLAVLKNGQKYFNINCTPCHGQFGAGDGKVITEATRKQRMPKPPELYSAKVLKWEDGRIYHIIMKGQGNMPSYADRMDRETRWAVVHYVKAIAKAKNGLVSLD